MVHLIDKDALVAEIERLKANALQKKSQCKRNGLERIMHQIGAYNKVISLIDTLEVKEINNIWHEASETPKGAGDKEILVQFSDFHTSVLEIDDWEYLDHQTKWAYLKDLI